MPVKRRMDNQENSPICDCNASYIEISEFS